MTPRQRYQTELARHHLLHDPHQMQAVDYLQALYESLCEPSTSRGWMRRLAGRSRPSFCKGVYLWGDVGRGKTYLMDQFFQIIPFADKQRWHFSEFMRYVHDEIARLSMVQDPLAVVSARLAERFRLLCLDEFHVDDVGDAMLLSGLLDGLFAHHVTLVMTSNRAPDELYEHGLQRARFLPAIESIKQHCHVVPLNGDVDYRMQVGRGLPDSYPVMSEADAHAWMQQRYAELTGVGASGSSLEMTVNGREIRVEAWSGNVLWSNFPQLCMTPRSADDYLEIARRFDVLLVTRIPVMREENDAAAQRFIHLVDALYDSSIRLTTALEVTLEEIYQGQRLAFSFRRAISRLYEMGGRG